MIAPTENWLENSAFSMRTAQQTADGHVAASIRSSRCLIQSLLPQAGRAMRPRVLTDDVEL